MGLCHPGPGWSDDPESIEAAQRDPDVFAKKMINQVTEHYLAAAGAPTAEPAVIGHSFGGLIARRYRRADDDRGHWPGPVPGCVAAAGILLGVRVTGAGNPANASRPVSLTFEQFSYGRAKALPEDETPIGVIH